MNHALTSATASVSVYPEEDRGEGGPGLRYATMVSAELKRHYLGFRIEDKHNILYTILSIIYQIPGKRLFIPPTNNLHKTSQRQSGATKQCSHAARNYPINQWMCVSCLLCRMHISYTKMCDLYCQISLATEWEGGGVWSDRDGRFPVLASFVGSPGYSHIKSVNLR